MSAGSDVGRLRLAQQQVAGPTLDRPAEVVSWLGSVQSQDYLGSLWAIGLRTRGAVESDVEHALATRAIVRTWPMRGTLHTVAAADVRWMLDLLAPRVAAAHAKRLKREFDLDDAVLARGRRVVERALEGGRSLDRPAIYRTLEAAGIGTARTRGLHILWRLALDAVVCLGARAGRQPTFALLDEWIPRARRFDRDESLSALARRYFTSHGPATIQDFAWWSGLTVAEARLAVELAKDIAAVGVHLTAGHRRRTSAAAMSSAYLLPAYDEFTVAYRDRSGVLSTRDARRPNARHAIFNPTIVIDGRVVGTWARTLNDKTATVALRPFGRLTSAHRRAIALATQRYSRFLAG